MSDDRAADLLALARELERRDLEVAAAIASVTGVLRSVDRTRDRARDIQACLESIPGEILAAEEAERDARAREAAARVELAEAERGLSDVGRSRRAGEGAKADAERAVRRAAVAAGDAAATVERMRERLEGILREEAALRAEGEGLAVEVREVAAAVAELPRVSESGRSTPGSSLAEIAEWGARAHAALFVVRGGLEDERERVVLEANTLAAGALGDHGGGSSVALVRQRMERALGGGAASA